MHAKQLIYLLFMILTNFVQLKCMQPITSYFITLIPQEAFVLEIYNQNQRTFTFDQARGITISPIQIHQRLINFNEKIEREMKVSAIIYARSQQWRNLTRALALALHKNDIFEFTSIETIMLGLYTPKLAQYYTKQILTTLTHDVYQGLEIFHGRQMRQYNRTGLNYAQSMGWKNIVEGLYAIGYMD